MSTYYFPCPGHLSIEVWQPTEASSPHLGSSSEASPPHGRVEFTIYYVYNPTFIDCSVDGSTHILDRTPPTRRQTSCSFDIHSFLTRPETSRAILAEETSSFGFQREDVDRLVSFMLTEGSDIIVSERQRNKDRGVIFITVEIMKEQHVWMHNESFLTQRAMRQSLQEFESRNYGMVPASELSLKTLLKRVRVTAVADSDDGGHGGNQESESSEIRLESNYNCTVCLEKVEVGTDAMSMPCSHVFHEDCIVQWLKQSHYCPVCRYEMPTH